MKNIAILIIFVFIYFCEAQVAKQVAFSAALSHDLVLAGGEDIVYDTVFINTGDGYDNTTGKFTCPQAGTYVFQFHGLSKNNEILFLELYQNYRYIASAFSHTDGDWAAAGNNVILHLSKGDVVNIRDSGAQDSMLFGSPSERYCTFSGYLIAPYFEETSVVG